MLKENIDKFSANQRNFIFGGTVAVITNLGLIMGFYFSPNAKASIISSVLVIAIADNISDSLGVHIFQEAELLQTFKLWFSTLGNFFTRLVVSLIFVILFLLLPLFWAAVISIIIGYLFLLMITYFVAKERKASIVEAILEHLIITTIVIVVSYYLGFYIMKHAR